MLGRGRLKWLEPLFCLRRATEKAGTGAGAGAPTAMGAPATIGAPAATGAPTITGAGPVIGAGQPVGPGLVRRVRRRCAPSSKKNAAAHTTMLARITV